MAVNTSIWRAKQHAVRAFAYFTSPTKILTGTINQTEFNYPIAEIAYTSGSGSYADVKVGMTLVFYDNSGDIKLITRVRKAPTSDTLYFAPASNGDVDLESTDTFKVFEDFRIWTKLPRILDDGTIYKDYDIAFSGQTLPPVCVAGPDRIGFVDGTGKLAVSFDLTDSYVTDTDATSLSYSAEVPSSAVLYSGSVASGIMSYTVPAGEHYFHFTVTDDLGATHTRHVRVVALNSGDEIPVTVRSLTGSRNDGWRIDLEYLGDSFDYLPGNQMFLFVREFYDGTEGSLEGYSGEEETWFVGWVSQVSVNTTATADVVRLTADGPIKTSQMQVAFPQLTQNKASPSKWDEVKDLTIFRHLVHLLHWHSTVLNVCDLNRPSWSYKYDIASELEAQKGSILSQIRFIAKAAWAVFTADRYGRLFCAYDPLIAKLTERDYSNVLVTLDDSDIAKITTDEGAYTKTHWIRGAALKSSSSLITPLSCIAPGLIPGVGVTEEQINNRIVEDQAELNEHTGHIYAQANLYIRKLSLTISRGGLVADPAYQAFVEYTLPDNRAAITLTGRFIVDRVDCQINQEGQTERWDLLPEPVGVPATTVAVEEDTIDDPSMTPYSDWRPLTDYVEPVSIGGSATGLIEEYPDAPAAFVATTGAVARTLDPTSPTWEKLFDNTSLNNRTIYQFILDPWNPRERAYIATASRGGGSSVFEIFEVTNLMGAAGAQSISSIYSRTVSMDYYAWISIAASINIEGSVHVLMSYSSYYSHSTDVAHRNGYGQAFTAPVVLHNQPTNAGNHALALGHHASSTSSGRVFASGNGPTNVSLYESTDFGNTWGTDVADPATWLKKTACITVPYGENPDDKILYYAVHNGDYTVNHGTYRRNSDGTWSYICPYDGSKYYKIADESGDQEWQTKNAMVADTFDPKVLSVSMSKGGSSFQLITTDDGGSTWDFRGHPSGSSSGSSFGLGGWPSNKNTLFAWSRTEDSGFGIRWTNNRGASWSSLRANIQTLLGNGIIIDFVPIWA